MNTQKIIDLDDKRFQKSPCSKCGTPCYHLCYIGKHRFNSRLVCVGCFAKACWKATKRRATGYEETDNG